MDQWHGPRTPLLWNVLRAHKETHDWAQVFGTYHWTFRGGLIYTPGATICQGEDYYFLQGEYGIYRITIRVLGPNPSGDVDAVAKGVWVRILVVPAAPTVRKVILDEDAGVDPRVEQLRTESC